MGALRPGIIWLNAWDLWARIITVLQRNQPMSQSTPRQSEPFKAALFSSETATIWTFRVDKVAENKHHTFEVFFFLL